MFQAGHELVPWLPDGNGFRLRESLDLPSIPELVYNTEHHGVKINLQQYAAQFSLLSLLDYGSLYLSVAGPEFRLIDTCEIGRWRQEAMDFAAQNDMI